VNSRRRRGAPPSSSLRAPPTTLPRRWHGHGMARRGRQARPALLAGTRPSRR
jgi:hypothetical protein